MTSMTAKDQDILINATLVNHSWKDATDSLPIQRALFFAPRSSNQGLKADFNPLLVEKFPSWFKSTEPKNAGYNKRGWEFKDLEWGINDKKCAAYKRKEASWRIMLPVQPSATVFVVREAKHYPGCSYLKVGEVTIKEGVRMGTIYDWAQKTARMPIYSFQMKWHMVHPDEDMEIDFSMPPDDLQILEENEKRRRGEGPPRVTMRTSYTMQCSIGIDLDVGPEFVSDGYEDLELAWVEMIDLP
ncbi:uncharacterized protein RCO7_04269 [Rhynchosporium graminicola]|uniref:Uncharacterized protein n=1 Tax=Rhynchosporium graminicola TaxID=2792576 RepID=A0A1E1LRB0_9HELO|nr:uncharacterized protein RCO7_04269 [Rhynchosporium commune]